jgi:mono/diheme cytochrome c family protein
MRMTIGFVKPTLVLALAGFGCSLAMAQAAPTARMDLGKREYDANCAVCHGKDGKGGGPFVELLKRSPPDLTTMAKRNNGVFPMQRAYESIEGGGVGHGTRDMPIWGRDYSVQAAEYYIDVPYNAEAYVRTKVFALVEYLSRLQAK